eukprot:TRINITY_DN65666_c0_g1_i1.p1 TRINITY_DN65666_c0_g1~~TRINITY_DN65666_c0_g1_i1.p1  ORF type:complete len:109 (-),score=10.06 TRINITY_DN65666_c0_g1_i1:251-577(-)
MATVTSKGLACSLKVSSVEICTTSPASLGFGKGVGWWVDGSWPAAPTKGGAEINKEEGGGGTEKTGTEKCFYPRKLSPPSSSSGSSASPLFGLRGDIPSPFNGFGINI